MCHTLAFQVGRDDPHVRFVSDQLNPLGLIGVGEAAALAAVALAIPHKIHAVAFLLVLPDEAGGGTSIDRPTEPEDGT
jgi:hypothetical protein